MGYTTPAISCGTYSIAKTYSRLHLIIIQLLVLHHSWLSFKLKSLRPRNTRPRGSRLTARVINVEKKFHNKKTTVRLLGVSGDSEYLQLVVWRLHNRGARKNAFLFHSAPRSAPDKHWYRVFHMLWIFSTLITLAVNRAA